MAALALTIGVDALESLAPGLKITETLNGRSRAAFGVLCEDVSYRPAIDATIALTEDSALSFGGLVDTRPEAAFGVPGGAVVLVSVSGVDFAAYASVRYLTGKFPGGTLKQWLQWVLPALAVFSVTLDPTQDDGPVGLTLPEIAYDYLSVAEALDQMSTIANRPWRIDYTKCLAMLPGSGRPAPFAITATCGYLEGDIEVEPASLSDYIDQVILRFTGSGSRAYAFLTNSANFADGETVTVGGHTYTFKTVLGAPANQVLIGGSVDDSLGNLAAAITLAGGSGSTYSAATTANTAVEAYSQATDILKVVALSVGAAGNTIAVATTAATASWYTEGGGSCDTLLLGSDVALTERVTSGTGNRVRVIEEAGVRDAAVAQLMADAYLVQLMAAPTTATVHYQTDQIGLHPGQEQSITWPLRGLSGSFLITDVEIENTEGDQMRRRVTAVSGTGIPARWQDDAKRMLGGSSSGAAPAVPLVPSTGGVSTFGAITGDTVTATGTGGWTVGGLAGFARVQFATDTFSFLTAAGAYADAIIGYLGLGKDPAHRLDIAASGTPGVSAAHLAGQDDTWTAIIKGGTTATKSYGLLIDAGTGASDYALVIRDAAGSVYHDYIFGDGFIFNAGTGGWGIGSKSGFERIQHATGTFTFLTSADAFAALSAAGGTFAGAVSPYAHWTYDLASDATRWRTLYAAELNVWQLVAKTVTASIGGEIWTAETTALTADVTAGATSIQVNDNNLASGDRIVLKSLTSIEWMAVTSAASGSAGAYVYSVTRDLDGTGANAWPKGAAVVNTGVAGEGLITQYALSSSILTGSTGPAIAGVVRTGTTWSNTAVRWALGNLQGQFGYAAATWGAAFGDASAAWLTIDATNGIRIGHGATTKIALDADGDALFAGEVRASAGYFGAAADVVAVDASGLDVGDSGRIKGGASSFTVGTGFWLGYDGAAYKFRVGAAPNGERFEWDGANVGIYGANWELSASGGLSFGDADDSGDVSNLVHWASGGLVGSDGESTFLLGPGNGANNFWVQAYIDRVDVGGGSSSPGILLRCEDASIGVFRDLLPGASLWNGSPAAPWDAFYGNGLTIYGDGYFDDNVSALSFTDRTPWPDGLDALAAVVGMKGTNGRVDHDTLPAFARRTVAFRARVPQSPDGEIVKAGRTETPGQTETGRDLGAMVSLLTVAMQQQQQQIEDLRKQVQGGKPS
jgi:hypothetical protein